MKTSVSISVFPAAPGMPALYSGVTADHLAEIRELGYDGVDLFVRDPESAETREAVRRLEQYGLEVGVIMPAALAGEGLYLTALREDVRTEAIRRIGEVVRLAGSVGGMVSLGLVRGSRGAEDPPEDFEARFAQACRALLELAAPVNVPLVVEPINRYEINTINSVAEAVEFLKRQAPGLFLMPDTFHMNIEDVDVESALVEALPYTKHIHFLDSNRLAPSMGHSPMERWYRRLEEAGYSGFLCLEALPRPDAHTCAAAGADFFRRMRTAG